ncbi:unnamed protein product [Aphanomyces euteiches]|uniref:PH domain-containing protein n=1 Tax=Aphanomyces euteiches TaxID=100861 RepID=A0A6G0XJ68_9STRA|nr:hypothetical protein Ae201684_004425 [Aphanomyces euteiches]KAH9108408.1 hypothetical protein AeMF1_016416 [Aphanomyces euteiches]KAH9147434.1 hypothetical protein AeRB84_008955 [Aphanomyces euteiches]KAH9151226.1 hypothetical protein AeRB84_006123 [Aphanomyces euteiches]KAH9162732.1 hypothetical protein LEN26_000812 [Aphanomyces euteiches]
MSASLDRTSSLNEVESKAPAPGDVTSSPPLSESSPASPVLSTTATESPSHRESQSTTSALIANDVIATSPQQATTPVSPRSNSFTKGSIYDTTLTPAMEWRNKSVSCDSLRGFETSRKTYIDPGQAADRKYWELFCQEVAAAREQNQRILRFFTLKIQADLAYADSLRRLRTSLELSADEPHSKSKSLQAASSCDQSITALAENQQQLCDKLETFTTAVQRDIITRPLQEMITKYDETAVEMLAQGDALDAILHVTQRRVQEAFAAYDGVFRDMERHRHMKDKSEAPQNVTSADLWLAEMAYGVQVKKLQRVRVEYVKGMANLFQQFKTLEVLRVSVTQTALDTFMRKQKLIFEELGGSMVEPLAVVQKIDPEKDLIQTIRRIPRNNTALALAADAQEAKFFGSFRSPLASPLLVRCGFVKYQVASAMFKSWREMFGVVTQDRFLHLFEMDQKMPDKSLNEFILEALPTAEDGIKCVTFASIYLPNCRLTIAKGTTPSFEITEAVVSTGLFSVFKTESTKRHLFQCVSQADLVDWIVATKRLIPDAVLTAKR